MKTYSIYPVLRIDKPNKNGLCPLYLRYTYEKKWKNISLSKTLDPKFWNKEENEPRKNCPNRTEILDLIRRKKNEVETSILNYLRDNEKYPTPDVLLKMSGIENTNIKKWGHYFDLFVNNQTENLNVENSTLEVYRQTREKLTDFENEKNISIKWKEINIDFYNQFVYFLRGKGLKDGTIGKHIKTLKSFLNFVSIRYNLLNPNQFRGFKTLNEEPDFVILSEKDLEIMKSSLSVSFKIKNQFVLNEREKTIIKLMILLCKTGMNFGDLIDLKIHDIFLEEEIKEIDYEKINKQIDNDELQVNLYIKKIRKKLKSIDKKLIPIIPITHEMSYILKLCFIQWEETFHEIIKNDFRNYKIEKENESMFDLWICIQHLIDRFSRYGLDGVKDRFPDYPYFFPQNISNVSFNKEIKQVLKKIGMIEQIKIIKKTSKNKIIEEIRPKYELITSRTGRRTNITSSLTKGVNHSIVMRSHGIKKMETLRRYENIPDKDIIEQMRLKNPIPQDNTNPVYKNE
jgi:site-specific recombinase XerD